MTVLLTWAAIFHDIVCDKHSLIDILITKLTKLKTPKFILGITRVTCLQAVIAVTWQHLWVTKKWHYKPFIVTQLFLVLSLWCLKVKVKLCPLTTKTTLLHYIKKGGEFSPYAFKKFFFNSPLLTRKDLPVCHHVSLSFCRYELKLRAFHVELEICLVTHLHNIYFKTVVSPRSEL